MILHPSCSSMRIKRLIVSGELARIARFCTVGLLVTVTYASMAWTLTVAAQWPATAASLVAWACATSISYFGHRMVTFRSTGQHNIAVPRFSLMAGLSLSLVLIVPAILTDHLGLHPAIAIGIVSIAVPALSYVVMSRLIFSDGRRAD